MGSDHGGGSFKLTLQIANIANPNSKHNTCLLLISNRKDIPENLRRLLGLFDEQFTTLQTTTWKHKKIRLFFYGDYDFLLKIYGISGAQSTHPCIFYKASKSQIQTPPHFNDGNIAKRSLANIRRQH